MKITFKSPFDFKPIIKLLMINKAEQNSILLFPSVS